MHGCPAIHAHVQLAGDARGVRGTIDRCQCRQRSSMHAFQASTLMCRWQAVLGGLQAPLRDVSAGSGHPCMPSRPSR